MLNAREVSLSVLSRFSHPAAPAAHFLTLLYSRLGSEMHGRLLPCVQEEWQWALSRGQLAAAFGSHRLRNAAQTRARRIRVHERYTVIAHHIDENPSRPAKRPKQLGYVSSRCTKHCPLKFQLTCQSWNEALPPFSKSHFHYYAPLIKLGHGISLTLHGHHSCEIIEQKITIHLTFFTGDIVAITPDWVGIWKLDVGASGTGQELCSREGAQSNFFFPPLFLMERIRLSSRSCCVAGPGGHRRPVKPPRITVHSARRGGSRNRRQ